MCRISIRALAMIWICGFWLLAFGAGVGMMIESSNQNRTTLLGILFFALVVGLVGVPAVSYFEGSTGIPWETRFEIGSFLKRGDTYSVLYSYPLKKDEQLLEEDYYLVVIQESDGDIRTLRLSAIPPPRFVLGTGGPIELK